MKKQGNISAVLWDMDGTLIDSESLHYEVLAALCRRDGLEWTREENGAVVGATMKDKWLYLKQNLGFSRPMANWLEEFNHEYRRRLTPELGFGSQITVVRRLHELNIPMACVSNGEQEVVQANLQALGIGHCFSVVIAHGDCPRGKPSPDPYLKACSLLQCLPERCLAVEDSALGTRAALDAGLVTVVWPAQSALPWDGPKADYIVRDQVFPWKSLGIDSGHLDMSV